MIVNLTPHPIDIYAPDVPGTVPDGVEPILSIAPEPVPARLAEAVVSTTHTMQPGSDHLVGVAYVEYGHAAGIPEPRLGTWLVVSLPVALALPDRSDLLVPYRQVRNAVGAVIGCRGFALPVPVS